VAFGNLGDVRLMEALGYAERRAIVIPRIRYELAEPLAPTMHERYPGLPWFTAVKTEEEKAGFETLGLRPIVDRSLPRGLDLAAAVLRNQGVTEEKIGAWVQLRQQRALELIFDGQSASDAYQLGTSRT
jgi:hypothetical protein